MKEALLAVLNSGESGANVRSTAVPSDRGVLIKQNAPGDVLPGVVEQLTLFDISLYDLGKSQ